MASALVYEIVNVIPLQTPVALAVFYTYA